jgi:hypothetical protein
MANEISVSVWLSVSKHGASNAGAGSRTLTMAGDQMINNVQIISSVAPEAVVLGDVGTIGYVFLKNLDSTNYVEIDSVNTLDNWPQRLLPGEFILLKPEGITMYALANDAPVNLQVLAVEL